MVQNNGAQAGFALPKLPGFPALPFLQPGAQGVSPVLSNLIPGLPNLQQVPADISGLIKKLKNDLGFDLDIDLEMRLNATILILVQVLLLGPLAPILGPLVITSYIFAAVFLSLLSSSS